MSGTQSISRSRSLRSGHGRRHTDEIAEQFAALLAYAEEQRVAGEPVRGPTFRVDALAWLKDAKRREMRCPKEREYAD